jgi:hypothetical protein
MTALPFMVVVPLTVQSDWSAPAAAIGLPALYTNTDHVIGQPVRWGPCSRSIEFIDTYGQSRDGW